MPTLRGSSWRAKGTRPRRHTAVTPGEACRLPCRLGRGGPAECKGWGLQQQVRAGGWERVWHRVAQRRSIAGAGALEIGQTGGKCSSAC